MVCERHQEQEGRLIRYQVYSESDRCQKMGKPERKLHESSKFLAGAGSGTGPALAKLNLKLSLSLLQVPRFGPKNAYWGVISPDFPRYKRPANRLG